ncbi:hypothetical protein [Nocardia wallacei]|uniref:hypothetical protein n=1 Tax=Nocardia wallacei TaxID=480035 RepID=UPI00245475F5|nr:hypothetical protein [Nocardia wallacei]
MADKHCPAAAFDAPYAGVDACSADAVMTAAVTAIFTYRPAVQPDQRSAFRSAAPLMAPEFALRAEPASMVWAPVTGSRWRHWSQAGVTVSAVVRVTGDDHPADTATTSARVLAVTAAPNDGSTPLHLTVYVRASRVTPAAGWRLSGLEVRS